MSLHTLDAEIHKCETELFYLRGGLPGHKHNARYVTDDGPGRFSSEPERYRRVSEQSTLTLSAMKDEIMAYFREEQPNFSFVWTEEWNVSRSDPDRLATQGIVTSVRTGNNFVVDLEEPYEKSLGLYFCGSIKIHGKEYDVEKIADIREILTPLFG